MRRCHVYSSLFSYLFLYLTVLLLWVPGKQKIPAWSVSLIISVILGLINHQLELVALVPIILLAFAVYYSQAEKMFIFMRIISGLLVIVLSIGLAAHKFPGFHNLKVLDNVYLSTNAAPFTFYLNFDKTIVGIFILGIGFQLVSTKKEWMLLFKQLLLKAPIVILSIIIAAYILGFIKFDPKVPDSIWLWMVTNLLFVCMAEEAFFRGFLQKNLALMMRKIRYGDYLALLIAAIFFGLAHYAGGIKFMALAAVAGLGYGWVYLTTKRIEGSILTHFGLNLTHFLLFTYPALVGAA